MCIVISQYMISVCYDSAEIFINNNIELSPSPRPQCPRIQRKYSGDLKNVSKCVYMHSCYLFDLVFKVSIIFVVDHLGKTNLFCCGLVNKQFSKKQNDRNTQNLTYLLMYSNSVH